MPNLNLTNEELDNLYVLLSVHSTKSAYDTFSVYTKVEKIVKSSLESSSVNLYNRNYEARLTLKVLDNGLIEFVKPEPEPEPDNPVMALVMDEMGWDSEVERIDENSFRLTVDDKTAVVTVSEPTIYP